MLKPIAWMLVGLAGAQVARSSALPGQGTAMFENALAVNTLHVAEEIIVGKRDRQHVSIRLGHEALGAQPEIKLHDEASDERVSIRLVKNGAPRVELFDAYGKNRIVIQLEGADGEPNILLFSDKGLALASMRISDWYDTKLGEVWLQSADASIVTSLPERHEKR